MKKLFPLLLLLVAINAFAGNDHKAKAKKQPALKKEQTTAAAPAQEQQPGEFDYGARTYDARLARMLYVDSAGNLPAEQPMQTVIGKDGKERKEDILDERLSRSVYVFPDQSKPIPAASIEGN